MEAEWALSLSFNARETISLVSFILSSKSIVDELIKNFLVLSEYIL